MIGKIASALAALALLFVAAEAGAVEPVPFDEVREYVAEGRFKKADRALHQEMLAVVQRDGSMDGQDLVRAIRYRALIEAGRGDAKAARWWWHAGLNLQSDGAAPWLELIPEAAADLLRPVKVRPESAPKPGTFTGPKRELKGDSIEQGSRRLYTPTGRRYRGLVRFEVEFDEENRLQGPLLLKVEGVPMVAVYAALEFSEGTRYPAKWRVGLPDAIRHQVGFSGWGRTEPSD